MDSPDMGAGVNATNLLLEAKSVLTAGLDLGRLQHIIDLGVVGGASNSQRYHSSTSPTNSRTTTTNRLAAPLVWTKSIPMMKLLLKHLCDPRDHEPTIGSGDSAMHVMCREANIPADQLEAEATDGVDPVDDRIHLLLEHVGNAADEREKFLCATNALGHTPVEVLCRYGGSVSALDALLSANAPVPSAALHFAAEAGHYPLCDYLIRHVHGRGEYHFLPSTTLAEANDGVTPMMRAAAEHHADIVELFVKHQQSLDREGGFEFDSHRLLLAADTLGRNALHYVALGSRKKSLLGKLPSTLQHDEKKQHISQDLRSEHREKLEALKARQARAQATICFMFDHITAEVQQLHRACKEEIRNKEAAAVAHTFVKATDLTGLTASQLSLKLDNRLVSEILVPLHQSKLLDTAPATLDQAVDLHLSATLVVAPNSETPAMKAQTKIDRALAGSPLSGGGTKATTSFDDSRPSTGGASSGSDVQPRYNYSTNVKAELQRLLRTSGSVNGLCAAAGGGSEKSEPTASELWRANKALLASKTAHSST